MEMQFHGANCITIVSKQARITIDDILNDLGGTSVTRANDIVLFTGPHADSPKTTKLVVDQPGEYEVSGVSVYGIAARSHLEGGGDRSATMYKLIIDDVTVLVTGHIYPELSDAQLEMIGMIDIMFVPVGGNGYTLDPVGALKVVKKIEPKLVVPTHYESKKLKFAVPQQPIEEALKILSMESKEPIAKFKPKTEDLAEGATRIIVLEES